MITFEAVTEATMEEILEILNSNPVYNELENGNPMRSEKEVRNEFLNTETESLLVKVEDRNIGVIDFLPNNPKDKTPWIGLLMIHGVYQGKGYGRKVYEALEEKLIEENYHNVRLGVLQENEAAKAFWITQGYEYYRTIQWEGKKVDCFEKELQ
ncbi:GNAT family N-acetyltransferase [Halobacillus sp. MO56]